jgi:hypothetical protein
MAGPTGLEPGWIGLDTQRKALLDQLSESLSESALSSTSLRVAPKVYASGLLRDSNGKGSGALKTQQQAAEAAGLYPRNYQKLEAASM